MAVAQGKQPASYVHAEIDGCAGLRLRRIHVSAESLRDQHVARLEGGRRDPDRSMEGLEGEACSVVGIKRLESNGLRGLVDLVDPGLLPQRILPGLGVMR